MSCLTISGLEVRMGQQAILRGLDLEVGEHAIVSVLGANGVGKTTLMRTIAGIYSAASGHIVFQGRDITNRPSHRIVREGIAQAPEGRQIFSNMSVAENLRLGALYLPEGELAPAQVRVLDLFPQLADRLQQKAGSLSGGEQQMLCIARALMGKPSLLLLDEPSLGLAPLLVRLIFGLVETIRASGTAVLLVEQNARAALKVADYAYVMDGGRIAFAGTPAALAADERVREAYLGGRA